MNFKDYLLKEGVIEEAIGKKYELNLKSYANEIRSILSKRKNWDTLPEHSKDEWVQLVLDFASENKMNKVENILKKHMIFDKPSLKLWPKLSDTKRKNIVKNPQRR